jgi:hypothetical protein
MADTLKIQVARVFAAISRVAASFFQLAVPRAAANTAKSEMLRQLEPRRLTIAEQWNYLTDIVVGAASRAEEATRCHASATLQLDLAQYALSSLVDELSAVMDLGNRRRLATVHVLGITPSPSPRPIGDAIAA